MRALDLEDKDKESNRLKGLEKLKELYGTNTIKHLEENAAVVFRGSIKLIAYNPSEDCTEIFAEGASALVMTRLYPRFLSDLKSHLSSLATARREVHFQEENPNLQDLLKAQAREVSEQINKLTASKHRLSKEEEQKIAESVVYAIAVLQDPLNPALLNKLIKNANQTVGASSRLKKFFGALSMFAFAAIVVFSIVAIPFTGGVSLPLGYAVGGSLLSASSAAGFFYGGKEKSVAREMSKLGQSLKDYQEDHKNKSHVTPPSSNK